jgi:DUF4097 and DUF4098 domain-containing protein YvlB
LRQSAQYFGPRFWFNETQPQRWEIGLTPRVPLDLDISGASGSADLNLAGLQLSALALDAGSGSMQVELPAGSKRYTARLNGGSGHLSLDIPAEASVGLDADTGSGGVDVTIGNSAEVELKIAGGSGHIAIDVPAEAAVRVEVQDHGSGAVNLPAALKLVSGSEGREGVWETAGFAQATHRITIVLRHVGSGSIEVR